MSQNGQAPPLTPGEVEAMMGQLINRAVQSGFHPLLLIGLLEVKKAEIILFMQKASEKPKFQVEVKEGG